MKISELAARSGESLSTLKYYLREGLLPRGASSSPNQADYGEPHVERLRLIGVLKEQLGMSVEQMVTVFREASPRDAASKGRRAAAQSRRASEVQSPELAQAYKALGVVGRKLGWRLDAADPASADAAEAIAMVQRVLPEARPATYLPGYAQALRALAEEEISAGFAPATDPIEAANRAALETHLFEPLLLALRRVARAQRVAQLAKARRSAKR